MIDKSWKLQRYDRKDYTELVEFPVEIVGRDGVVRRYSFEEAIRLYQRRISFAGVRYRDTELVRAEALHCRARIEQLRRSWFHRFGWATPNGEVPPEQTLGDIAGEVAAFLGRSLHASGRLECRVDPVNVREGGVGTWYVVPASGRGGMLLEIYRFETAEHDFRREEFFRKLRDLERIRPEGELGATPDDAPRAHAPSTPARGSAPSFGDTGPRPIPVHSEPRGEGAGEERLIAAHHVLDCGFLLTGDSEAANAAEGAEDVDEDSIDLGPTPWDEAVDAIRRGEQALALRRCREVIAAQPWHRQAYTAGSALAVFVDEPALAEELALLGSKFFPTDGVLRYYLAVARFRQGREMLAEEAVREAVRLSPELGAARLLLAAILIHRGRLREARQILAERVSDVDGRVDPELAWFATGLRWRSRLGIAILTVTLLVLPAAWFGGVALALVPALAVVAGMIGWLPLRRHLEARARQVRPAPEDLGIALRRVTRREAAPLVS